jgi:5,10-methylenetetrahydromethanopterin reductase
MTTRVGLCFLDRPDLARCLRLVRMAEELGFSEAWVCETRLARDAISVLGAFAAVTGRIRLGTGIINSWTRAAPLTAMTFATLDELAPGRTMLGLGAYWDPLAWKQGITRRKPLRQMREYVEVVRRLRTWSASRSRASWSRCATSSSTWATAPSAHRNQCRSTSERPASRCWS